jgi:hypothetical protein
MLSVVLVHVQIVDYRYQLLIFHFYHSFTIPFVFILRFLLDPFSVQRSVLRQFDIHAIEP